MSFFDTSVARASSQCVSITVTVTGLEPISLTPVKTSLVSGKIRASRDHNAK